MDKRLRIAKRLLSEKGVIFISIDDYEQATLKLLCDEIFTEMNFVSNIIWQRAFSPINLKKTISQNHDFILIYCKQDFTTLELNKLPRSIEASNRYKNPDNDERGDWTSGDLSVGPPIEKNIYTITTPSGREVLPPKGYSWRLSEDRLAEFISENRIWFGPKGDGVPRIKRFLSDVKDGVVTMSLWTHNEVGHTQDAKKELKEVLHENERPFETVKPIKLIDRIFKLTTDNKKPYTILDFFAGSGTTLHATMALNAEDGGNRQCILVTNNENNICEEVTYERNKRVIQGYTNAKGVAVAGLENNNLRYYKSEFLSRETSLKNKRELTYLATELLCIKEDCYSPSPLIPEGGTKKPNWYAAFTSEKSQFIIIYDESKIEDSFEIIEAMHAQKTNDNPVKVYVFSHGQYPFTEDFEEVLPFITLCALPDAIYKAYQNVLPKKKRDVVPVLEEDAIGGGENLFNQDAH
jgi:adenine-specific DNA-methyltransferase